MATTLAQKAKGVLALGVVVLALVLTAPIWSNDSGEDHEMQFGPRNPGTDKKFGCRYMSLDIEVSTYSGHENGNNESFPGVLNADLGSAGKIVNQRITVPNFRLHRGYFKQEFCAKPGDALYATVALTIKVLTLTCYFYFNEDPDGGNATTSWMPLPKGNVLMSTTWCRGVVPT